jgi:nucleoside-diphosphate-sugar epimerase
MKILITGSKGFIGKHLTSYLAKKRYQIVSYDLLDGKNILDEKQLKKDVRRVDAILHLAAYGDVYQATNDPVGAVIAGAATTAMVVKVANEYNIKKIVYASTWEVYGKPKYQPIDENHSCTPDHPYSISKYGGELIIQSKLNNVPWIILRLGSAFGTEMRPYAVIPMFINRALDGKKIVIHGNGTQFRQFVHTDDINHAFFQALKSTTNNRIYNIVGDEILSIKDIADLIIQSIPTKIVFVQQRSGDVISAHISSFKAKKYLRWRSKTLFKVGLSNLIRYMRSRK